MFTSLGRVAVGGKCQLPDVAQTMDITNPNHALFIRFRHLLESHFKEGWRVWQYAEQLGVSEKMLASAVRITAGLTPSVIVKDRTIMEARRLLQYSDLSISAIALSLGGMDQSNFNNFFRTGTGETPSEYRKRKQKENVYVIAAERTGDIVLNIWGSDLLGLFKINMVLDKISVCC